MLRNLTLCLQASPPGYVGHIEIWILLQGAALLAIAVCRWVVSQEMTYRVNILDLE